MHKRLPNISIEKYAAYLDGNLSDEEMQQIESFIEKDSDMQEFLATDGCIDADFDLDSLDDELIPLDIELASIELPSIDTRLTLEQNSFVDNFFSSESDRFSEETGSLEETNRDGFPIGSENMYDVINTGNMVASEEISEQVPFDYGMDSIELPSPEEDLPFEQDVFF